MACRREAKYLLQAVLQLMQAKQLIAVDVEASKESAPTLLRVPVPAGREAQQRERVHVVVSHD